MWLVRFAPIELTNLSLSQKALNKCVFFFVLPYSCPDKIPLASLWSILIVHHHRTSRTGGSITLLLSFCLPFSNRPSKAQIQQCLYLLRLTLLECIIISERKLEYRSRFFPSAVLFQKHTTALSHECIGTRRTKIFLALDKRSSKGLNHSF